MNDEIKKIIEDKYDDSKEEGFMSMLSDFYNRKTLSVAIFAWIWGIIFIAGAIYCGVEFFKAQDSKFQIMFASLFITFMIFLSIIKVFAWELMNRNNIKREIKRLELRIAELTQIIKSK
jgi:hypothetical protein